VYSKKKTPDDGQRNCPKHVEFPSKNKFEKLVHLVGFILRDACVHYFLFSFNAFHPLGIFNFSVCFCSPFQFGFVLGNVTKSEHLQNVSVVTNSTPYLFFVFLTF